MFKFKHKKAYAYPMSMIGPFHTLLLLCSATYASHLWCLCPLRSSVILSGGLEVCLSELESAASAPTSSPGKHSSSFSTFFSSGHHLRFDWDIALFSCVGRFNDHDEASFSSVQV